jgi:hypothetical protein
VEEEGPAAATKVEVPSHGSGRSTSMASCAARRGGGGGGGGAGDGGLHPRGRRRESRGGRSVAHSAAPRSPPTVDRA